MQTMDNRVKKKNIKFCFWIVVICVAVSIFISQLRMERVDLESIYSGLLMKMNIIMNTPLLKADLTILPNTLVRSTNWERLIKNDPPITDWRTSSNPKSSVTSVHVKKKHFIIGDDLIVNITVRDFNGARKKKGGDVVRVMARNAKKGSGSIGYVIDHGNGAYTGVIKLLWAGSVTIVTQVGSSREMIQILYRIVTSGRTKKPIVGTLPNKMVVPCTPYIEKAKRFRAFCNFTENNAELPWFCEKPSNSCVLPKFHYITNQLDISYHEKHMLNRTKEREVPNPIVVEVDKGPDNKDFILHGKKLPACNSFPAKATWSLTSPVGCLYKSAWYPLHCTNTFQNTRPSFERCLKKRNVWFIGDSNSREMFSYLKKTTNMTLETEKWTKAKWHRLAVASNANKTVHITFAFHAMPRYSLTGGGVKGTHTYIDSIPANSTDVIIVHFYVHFQPFHPSVVREHIRKAVESIRSLKIRAPRTTVVVRGCHALLVPTELTHFDDMWGIVYDRILKEEFLGLYEQVYFLDMWDLTVAMDNRDVHPKENILKKSIAYLMSLICG